MSLDENILLQIDKVIQLFVLTWPRLKRCFSILSFRVSRHFRQYNRRNPARKLDGCCNRRKNWSLFLSRKHSGIQKSIFAKVSLRFSVLEICTLDSSRIPCEFCANIDGVTTSYQLRHTSTNSLCDIIIYIQESCKTCRWQLQRTKHKKVCSLRKKNTSYAPTRLIVYYINL